MTEKCTQRGSDLRFVMVACGVPYQLAVPSAKSWRRSHEPVVPEGLGNACW